MVFSRHQIFLLRIIFIILFLALLLAYYHSFSSIWKSVYIENNQSVEYYNSIKLGALSKLERGYKSLLPNPKSDLGKVRLYISEKNQNKLLSDLPYSRSKWVKGLVEENDKLVGVKVKHRGDNPNNWLHGKKSWRVKRKKSKLKDGVRVHNYVMPRDSGLISTYMGYFIAGKLGILTPKVRFVELYINDAYQGLYLEIEHMDEGFLRHNDVMPVNIYKGTPSRTDKPLYIDTDLFNNPSLWEKRAVFNARSKNDNSDIESLFSMVRDSVNSPDELDRLENVAPVHQWAKFSVYETIMQTWHNYEKNNMHLVSDPWLGIIYPLSYDSIFNDTKIKIIVDEEVRMDNAAHALMELYTNNPDFLYEKYRLLKKLLDEGIYDSIRDEAKRVYSLIDESWRRDPARFQTALSNGFSWKLALDEGMNEEVSQLFRRIDYIEKAIRDKIDNIRSFSWRQDGAVLSFSQRSLMPVTSIKICADRSIGELQREGGAYQSSQHYSDGCSEFSLLLNSNRFKPVGNRSRVTTFFAGIGFKVVPTVHNFSFEGVRVHEVHVKYLGDNNYSVADRVDSIGGVSPLIHNVPVDLSGSMNELVWSGDKKIEGTVVIEQPIVIEAGTRLLLAPDASIIFKSKVFMNGQPDNKIKIIRSGDRSWGVLAVVGPETVGSVMTHVDASGGSGGVYAGMYFTGMFSVYDTSDIRLDNIRMSSNSDYDDLIHVLYSNEVELVGSEITLARSDAIDIDISDVKIIGSKFLQNGNDAIDSMTSRVEVVNTVIRGSGDKGISVGESSTVNVDNVTFDDTEIAIQSKDASVATVTNSTFLNNKMQLNCYKKNWRYNNGGTIRVSGSRFMGINNDITAKNRSSIEVSDSLFNKDFMHMQTKKVKFDNSRVVY